MLNIKFLDTKAIITKNPLEAVIKRGGKVEVLQYIRTFKIIKNQH